MSSWRQEGLLHGNQRNKQLSQCPPQNPNMLCFRKPDEKLFSLETYTTNLASHRWDQQSSKATMKVQLFYHTILNFMRRQNTLKYATIDWVRDLVNDKVLDVQNCHNLEQMADILTKPLPKPK